MTLDQAFENQEFIEALDTQNFPNAFSFLDKTEEKEKLFLVIQKEGINPLNKFTVISSYFLERCNNLTHIQIPETVWSIGPQAFSYCKNLIEINIPNRVTTIDYGTFLGCANLREIIIPNGVTSINRNAFCGCSKLVKVVIPDTIILIDNGAFDWCSSLKEIQFKGRIGQLKQLKLANTDQWRKNSSIEKIICTNGVINL